jgi:uncharacterized protein YecE (DUF72 family)
MSAGVRIGTSGWQYADWRGSFYPAKLPQRLWLTEYAKSFDTVEVNSTFYRLPTEGVVARWAQTVPAGFVMTVKASRYLTHVKRLREPEEPVARLLTRLTPLRERGMLGAILLQLPPSLPAAPELLDATLAQFPADLRIAVEPREPTWFTDAVRCILEARSAALVWADRGGAPLGPLWETCDWRYLRLHHGRTNWGYDQRDLRRWAGCFNDGRDGYIYANNDPGAAAVNDARCLRTLLA